MNKPADRNDKKKGGLSSAFSAFGGVIDDIVNEVKQDLKEMTPEQKQVSAREKMLQNASGRAGIIGSATGGLSENEVAYTPPSAPTPVAATPGLPAGNLWHALRNPAYATALRADSFYHALTPADLESYARAVGTETKPPFTLGLMAVNFAALTDDELAETNSEPDLITQTLIKAVHEEPRLFGVVGAGPRQLWQNLDALDTFLTNLLNTQRKFIGVGPIGLDEPFAPYTLPQQQAQLAVQLEIAAEFGIPAYLSTRKTQEKLAETLGTMAKLPTLVYADALTTAEDAELVQRFKMFALVRPELTAPDFAGKVYYREIASDRLLLGSGSALVAPHGFAGHFNQPKFLENSLTAAAKLRGTSVGALGPILGNNLVQLLGV
jgi:Tat protein secretion system quality control protein TatD with DNase activity